VCVESLTCVVAPACDPIGQKLELNFFSKRNIVTVHRYLRAVATLWSAQQALASLDLTEIRYAVVYRNRPCIRHFSFFFDFIFCYLRVYQHWL